MAKITHIFIVHGIFSEPKNLQEIGEHLDKENASAKIILYDYNWKQNDSDWKQKIHKSGIDLKDKILDEIKTTKNARVLLIGHSQGGLVCRVASLLLEGESLCKSTSGNLGWEKEEIKSDIDNNIGTDKKNVICGVITLATPNGGALTYGQMNLLTTMMAFGTKKLISAMLKMDNMTDLSSDRLLGLMQFYTVKNVKYLTVSGSYVNRFSGSPSQLMSHVAKSVPASAAASTLNFKGFTSFVGGISVSFEKPNDFIVEDVSVDLRSSHIKTEIHDLDKQVTHCRQYFSCGLAHHTNIHKSPAVWEIMDDWIAKL